MFADDRDLTIATEYCDQYSQCGHFIHPKYLMCHNNHRKCTFMPWLKSKYSYSCGSCPDTTRNQTTFAELQWEDACAGSPYNKIGTIYFCKNSDTSYGYRLTADGTCGPLAPLIRVFRGGAYQLRLVNQADENTNIHTHGFHVDGDGNADDVTREVTPGNCLFYDWTIPLDHFPGTHWYHPHFHTLSEKQTNGGAMGMILVDAGAFYGEPSFIKNNELILQIAYNSNNPTRTSTVLANGNAKETIIIAQNTWYYLRVLVADVEALLRPMVFGSNCIVHPLAYDGVWLNSVPGAASSTYTVSGATRVDFAIKCNASDTLNIATAFDLTDFREVVQFMTVGSNSDPGDLATWTPERPTYLTDLRSLTVAQANTAFFTNNAVNFNGDETMWDATTAIVPRQSTPFGSVHEWTLTQLGLHPFHLHVHHFQVVTPGGCGNIYQEGEWYDTIVTAGNDCVVRFRNDDFGGRTIFHCHILNHEDNGAMGWFDVTGGPGQGTLHIAEQACATECYA